MLCSKCNKNIAVVFVTKVEGDVKKNEGLCMSCAKQQGVGQIDDIMKQMGIDEEQFDELNREMMENPPEITPEKNPLPLRPLISL